MSTSFSKPEPQEEADLDAGLAHVTTASFLAARLAPSAGFALALAGGVALARTAVVRGARHSYGASLAAMLQTVALMGPMRLGVPLTQALTAPWVGYLEARKRGAWMQFLVTFAVRFALAVVAAGFAIIVVTGYDSYIGSVEAILRIVFFFIPFADAPQGEAVVLVLGVVQLLLWCVGATTVQIAVYRRALVSWGTYEPPESVAPHDVPPPRPSSPETRRFDPRIVALAAAGAFALLLVSTQWVVLAAAAAWLGLAWLFCRGDEDPEILKAGFIFAGALAFGAAFAVLLADNGAELAARRGLRAGLLVLVATWLRVAAGPEGLRETARRGLHRLRRLPVVPETAAALDRLGDGRQLIPAGKELLEDLEPVEKKPVAIVDVVLRWVAAEAARFRPAPATDRLVMNIGVADALLFSALLLASGSLIAAI